ncbi:MAG: hypothetical protein HQM13_24055 [SAR324 cluster bacterium]|nr:hypothetical protein [SAR324 cluster bacterium]
MNHGFQKFGFKESSYEYPSQDWICGWAADGHPCPAGPGAQGHCQTKYECEPSRRGDRWFCNRPEHLGEKCTPDSQGICARLIPPCQPVRSARAKRGVLVKNTIALTLGLFLILFAGSFQDNKIISPGDLALQHSMIQNDCERCHPSSGPFFESASAGSTEIASEPSQSSKCQECHFFGKNSLFSHGVAPPALQQKTVEITKESAAGFASLWLKMIQWGPSVPQTEKGELACATCHREHQGSRANLAALGNQQCQVCHANPFFSFSKGHPDFQQYPYYRRTRIQFNHLTHMSEYFHVKTKSRPFVCSDCHQPDISGNYMVINGYDASCSLCHETNMSGKEYVFFSIPELDLGILEKRQVGIGEWPQAARGSLTPFMGFLLAQNESAAEALIGLEELDLTSLSEASDQQLKSVWNLVWSIKLLFYKLKNEGHDGLTKYLEEAARKVNFSLDKSELISLTGQIPETVLVETIEEWFPNLEEELQQHREQEAVFTLKAASSETPEEDKIESPEEKQLSSEKNNGDDSAVPFPVAGEPDAVDADLDDVSAELKELLAEIEEEPEELLGDLDDVSAELKELLAEIEEEPEGPLGDLDDVSAELKELLAEIEEDPFTDEEGPVMLTDRSKVAGEEETDLNEKEKNKQINDDPSEHFKKGYDWALMGGWYRQNNSLRYRASGHANPFLKTWLDFLAHQADEKESYTGRATAKASERLFAVLSDLSSGICTKCHGIDNIDGGESSLPGKQVQWRAKQPTTEDHLFTRFTHRPHLRWGNRSGGESTAGCLTCHLLNGNSSENYRDSFVQNRKLRMWSQSNSYTSNFNPINKELCSNCHNSNGADNSCLACHNYHVGRIQSVFH